MTALDAGVPRTAYGVVPANCRLILASDSLLDLWGTRTERGERITVEWGEPSPEGWYEPVFTVHSDDVLAVALDAAWREAATALAAITPPTEATIEGIGWEKGKDGPPDARFPDRWHARAYRWDAARPWHRKYADGPTPAAALLALAAALRKPVTA